MESSFTIQYHYRIHFTKDVFAPENPVLAQEIAASSNGHVLFAVEKNIVNIRPGIIEDINAYSQHHKDRILPAGKTLIIDGAEKAKNLAFVKKICGLLSDAQLCRHSCLIMIGGGAFLDTCGMAAGIFHRGMRQIRIPTTGLAQCDSGVGVKNGINAFGFKNLLGVFAPPAAVINDSSFLRTLTPVMISSAAAEAVKVAMIKDADFFQFLQNKAASIMKGDFQALEKLIHDSAVIHANHIATNGDPFEYGSARPLDFGHWAAHKIEMLSKGTVPHGIAVGMGMLIDTLYAVNMNIAQKDTFLKLRQVLADFQMPFHKQYLHRRLLKGISDFQQHIGGELNITLVPSIGNKIEVNDIDLDVMAATLNELAE